jgi:hypothetical protein
MLYDIFYLYKGVHLLTQFAVLVCLCICRPDDGLAEVKTCRKDISDKWLFIIHCAVCWIKWYNQSPPRNTDYLKCILDVHPPSQLTLLFSLLHKSYDSRTPNNTCNNSAKTRWVQWPSRHGWRSVLQSFNPLLFRAPPGTHGQNLVCILNTTVSFGAPSVQRVWVCRRKSWTSSLFTTKGRTVECGLVQGPRVQK